MHDFIDFTSNNMTSVPLLARLIPVILSFLIISGICFRRNTLRNSSLMERAFRLTVQFILLLAFFIEYPLRYLQTGFSIQVLPLHLCSLGAICAFFLLSTHNRILFSFLCCGCFPGALAAMLFPAIHRSYNHIQYYAFMLLHMSILITTAYYYIVYEYRVSARSFSIIILCLQIASFFIGAANDYFETSYWYLSYQRPLLSNGIFSLLGDGITYFIRFDLLALLMFLGWEFIYFKINSKYEKYLLETSKF